MGPLTWWIAQGVRQAGVRVAFVVHNVLPHEPRPGDEWLTRHVLCQGHSFVVHTEAELARLLKLRPQANARVVAHPTYGDFVDHAMDREAARRELGIPADAGVILFFGFVRPYKGLHVLLEALAGLRQAGQSAHLIVAGEFWGDPHVYEREIAALRLGSCVHLTRRYIPDKEVGAYFWAADVFAAPYTAGTQSGAVTIARSFGLPIVTTRPEDIAGQPAGPLGVQVVAAGDVKALVGALDATLRAVRAVGARPTRSAASAQQAPAEWEHLAQVVAEAGRPK
jgi:glycosyltransferase involved in cell wall biosynthesis